jgi:Cof subfamily protein (haloacid dehalogenase superfamily)
VAGRNTRGVNSRPRLVATDLDGTLVRSDGSVSDRTRAALALVEDAGVTLLFVTGRPPRWMAPIVDATGHRGLAICANGALLYDLHTEQVIDEHLLDPAAAAAVVAALRAEIPNLAFAVERGTAGFSREAAYQSRWPQPGAVVAEIAELVALPVVKMLVRHAELNADDLLARARRVLGPSATLTHSSTEGLLEISAAGVSKATGLARFAAERGLEAAHVLAFGDMPNDLPMLTWAGRSVAVANAHPEVIAAADEITAANDDDGVALVLERLYAD